MIDWSKLSAPTAPAAAPAAAPTAPTTTAPVGASTLPNIAAPTPQVQFGTGKMTDAERNLTPEQQEKMTIFDRAGLGVDILGDVLFGNGSPLHNTPVDWAVGAAGDLARGVGDWTVIKPIQAGVWGLNQVPLGWLPGGADESFKQIGEWAKANDPALYAEWQKVDAAAAGKWEAGNLHAQFNTEALQYLDDKQKESFLGTSPALTMGRAAVGSLGGALGNAISGWLGLGAAAVQKGLGDVGWFNPDAGGPSFEQMLAYHKSPNSVSLSASPTPAAAYAFKQMDEGKWSEQEARDYVDKASGHLSRVEESAMRLDRGEEVSDLEKLAIDAWRSGDWSLNHANTYILTHGQGITRNPWGQIAGSIVYDPLTVAAVGAGTIAKAGVTGARLAEAGMQATTRYEQLATMVYRVQQSQMGPAFRIARGLIDPLAVYKPSSVARATTDLRNGVALSSFERAYGPQTVTDLRALAREAGVTREVDSAMASYSIDQANLMIAQRVQRTALEEGLAEELARTGVDDTISPMVSQASRDAETQLTDHMMQTAKNTFTAQEEANLAGRLAQVFGKDANYWAKRISDMSFDLKTALHAITFKRAEVEFTEALGLVDRTATEAPIDRMVLMNAGNLDDVTAEAISQNIRDMLASEEPQRIAAATNEWNWQAHQYPAMANIGYAPGGKEQLEKLVTELEQQIKEGGIMRRLTEKELADPAMAPVRDFLGRNTMPPRPGAINQPFWTLTPEERAAQAAALRQQGYVFHGSAVDPRVSGTPVAGEGFFTTTSMEYAEGYGRGTIKNSAEAAAKGDVYLAKLPKTKVFDLNVKAFRTKLQKGVAADLAELAADSRWEFARTALERAAQRVANATDARQLSSALSDYAIERARMIDPLKRAKVISVYDRSAREWVTTLAAEDGTVLQATRSASKAEAQTAKSTMEQAIVQGSPFDNTFVNDLLRKAGAKAVIFPEESMASVVAGAAADAKAGTVVFVDKPSLQSVDELIGPKSGGPLWRVGFRPDETVAWGLKRDANTGRYIIDRDPTISHVIDAVPGRQPFSDTTRDILGRIVGKEKAEALNKPIDSIEAFGKTMTDMVTGRRLVANMERRFERSMFDAGIPKPISKAIMAKAKEVAGMEYTTLRGVRPGNLWQAISDELPRDLRLADGSTLNVHIIMDHLLRAAEGDLRIMGVTSVMSQRVRNILRRAGIDPANWLGATTVTLYNKLRYSQPTFLIQRIGDAPYYSILYGVTPVGRKALSGANAELEKITENLGRTGFGRDFSMDMPEYATRTNFTAGIKSKMQEVGVKENRLNQIIEAPDVIIANNMTNMLYHKLGDIVRGALDNLTTAAEKADPALQAEMLQAGEQFQRTFADIRNVYSQQAGRALDDNEVGLRYIQDQLNAWRRHVVNENGTLDFSRLIAEGERAMPTHIADVGPIKPDILAQELGYADAAAMRTDIAGRMTKVNGQFVFVPGEHDIAWLEEVLRDQLHAHPDYIKRAVAYFGNNWNDFWYNLSRPVGKGGLDISAHYAKEAQDLIATIARDRGMDPWEYLSGVMAVNLDSADMSTAMGQLVSFLKSGKVMGDVGEWTAAEREAFFRSHLDPSAQRTLMEAYGGGAEAAGRTGATGTIETKMAAGDVAGSQADNIAEGVARGGTVESGGAVKPSTPAEQTMEFKAAQEAYDKSRAEYAQAVSKYQTEYKAWDAEQKAYKTAQDTYAQTVQDVKDKAQEALDAAVAKWQDAPKNHLNMEKTLIKMEQEGWETGEAMDALEEYRAIDRSDYTDAVEYQEARDDAWQEVLDRMGEMDPEMAADSVIEKLTEPVAPTLAKPVAPPVPTVKSPKVAAAEAVAAQRVTMKTDYDAGWRAAKASKTADATAATKRYGLSHPDKAGMFSAGWSDAKTEGVEKYTAMHASPHWNTPDWVAAPPAAAAAPAAAAPAAASPMAFAAEDVSKFWDTGIIDALKQRVASGPHPNPDVEAAIQQVAHVVQTTLKGSADESTTRTTLRSLVEGVPTAQRAPFNRTQFLVVQLLKQKIEEAQRDVFRLAEMQTSRSVLERSLNHPLFGLYPASYMWGKVLPESLMFFARNPYAATYAIADVSRAIAMQREYDPSMEDMMSKVDHSSMAFLMDYLTPGLPWNDHAARMSPMVRDLFKGQPQNIWTDELATVSPERWIKQFGDSAREALTLAQRYFAEQQAGQNQLTPQLNRLENVVGAIAPGVGSGTSPEITGPVPGSALGPILADDLTRLQSILLSGASPEQ